MTTPADWHSLTYFSSHFFFFTSENKISSSFFPIFFLLFLSSHTLSSIFVYSDIAPNSLYSPSNTLSLRMGDFSSHLHTGTLISQTVALLSNSAHLPTLHSQFVLWLWGHCRFCLWLCCLSHCRWADWD